MKTLYFIIFSGLILFACSGGSGGGGGDITNTAPSIPVLISPTNAILCIDNVVDFQWNASSDAENDPLTYQLQISTNNQFTQNVINRSTSTNHELVTLGKGTAYYWRVKAKDNQNASSDYSSTFSLYSEGDGQSNHLPFLPQLVSPLYDSVVAASTVTLDWTASDPDYSDVLTYDVYLGINNPPTTKVAEGISGSSFNANSLTVSEVYYWYVVVKDNNAGVTIGQIWSFNTN